MNLDPELFATVAGFLTILIFCLVYLDKMFQWLYEEMLKIIKEREDDED